ncbi:tyrosine-protein kinase FRK-like [Anneissia japonica]|uniref:tyrosine-protein kinase FRK-like n=1 Tax=Anneissia japonica TaxID=1529436 RepID=UPI00142558E8|nr:tyrosine-protein kinase FRK-like [Anneissia japonica]
MDYLSKTRYYHGDLAARNILVGTGLIVKVSDFGLADDIYQSGYKRLAPEKKRPVKWVSLETNMEGKCTIKSDVWSFGIVLYEIYTNGGPPYPEMDASSVIQKLATGYRMEKPTACPQHIYDIMMKCWKSCPNQRPTFNDMFMTFDSLLEMGTDYLETDPYPATIAVEENILNSLNMNAYPPHQKQNDDGISIDSQSDEMNCQSPEEAHIAFFVSNGSTPTGHVIEFIPKMEDSEADEDS